MSIHDIHISECNEYTYSYVISIICKLVVLVMQAAIKRTNKYTTDISFMIIYVMLLS